MKKKILVIMVVLLFVGVNVLYAAGDLAVLGSLGIGRENTHSTVKLSLKETVNGPAISLVNDLDNVWIFQFKANQTDHLSTIPGALYDYYLFENSGEGLNKELRVYGYPIGANGLSYGALQMVGTTADFEIKTGGSANNILLTPALSAGVGIGTTDTAGYKLYVSGSVYASGGYYPSDISLKKDINSIESPLKKILNIKGVSYTWKTEEYKDRGFVEGRHFGIIGQEVERVLPEIVKETSNGEKNVAYTEMIPVLIEAIKEQQKIIERQQKDIEELKSFL
jgi:hypothetical protein